MACTYTFQQNATVPSLLEVLETNPPIVDKLDVMFNLSSITWVKKSDDNIEIKDCCGNKMNVDIDDVPAFATVDDLIAYLEPLRLMFEPAGGGALPPVPVAAVATTDYLVTSAAAGATAANLFSVSFTNTGAANGTIDAGGGAFVLVPTQTVTYTAYLDPVTGNFNRIPAITYSAVGTSFSIATIA